MCFSCSSFAPETIIMITKNLNRKPNLSGFGTRVLGLVCLFLVSSNIFAQSATTANISGTNSVITITNNSATPVDANLLLTANGNITGFTISITGSYTSGDALSYTGTLPSGITAAAFNASTRSLVFSGTTSAANWQTLLRTVTLRTTSAVCNPESRKVSFVIGNKYYNILNQHFYEIYATASSWTGARAYADATSYFGRKGYLSTITSMAENSFSSVLLGQNSWIGCSDNYLEINSAVGYTLYANQAAADGNFYWVTGPERGLKISSKNAWASGGITPVSGVFNNWAGAEPNDWPGQSSTSPGEEDYGHMYSGAGNWNDFPNNSSIASVIEYEGMPGDNTSSQVVFTRNIYINGAPSGTINGGNVSVCSGTNSTVLTLSGLTGTVVRWERSVDNFLTAGTTISSTSNSYTVTNISVNTYYRAIVNTTSGCSGLATSSTPIFVNSTVSGNIVAANNTICAGAQAEFTLYGNSGNVTKWQVSTSSTFASGVTDINSTNSTLNYTLSTAGTRYFRAAVQNNGCGSPVYTPGYTISVITGASPVGGTVSSTSHCGGSSNTGTLSLTGYTGTVQKWQYSVDGGIIWVDVANTSASLTYTGVGANRIYRAKLVNGSCGTAYSSNGVVTVYGTTVSRWDGGTSTAWEIASNWCGGVPDNGMDVVLNISASNNINLDRNRIVGNWDFNGSNKTVTLGNFTLTASSFTNVNSSNYVITNGSGVLKMNIPNGITKNFPVGNGSYTPVSITNNTGSSDYMYARVLNEVFNNGYTGYVTSIGRVKRTWDIGKTNANGGSGLTFVFNWNNGETVNLLSPNLYHYENGTWNKQTGSFSTSGNTFTYTGYTGTFSPFAIGSGLTPLPIDLLSFDAKAITANRTVLLTWKTTMEVNNKCFDVQRSIDGVNWITIGNVASNGNNKQLNEYSFVDNNPESVNYYRFVQIDFEGNKTAFDIRKVDFNNVEKDIIKLYPNPSRGTVELFTESFGTYVVMDIDGKIVTQGEVDGLTQLNDLNVGMYVVQVTLADKSYQIKLVIE